MRCARIATQAGEAMNVIEETAEPVALPHPRRSPAPKTLRNQTA
jgi:hypothetical protein